MNNYQIVTHNKKYNYINAFINLQSPLIRKHPSYFGLITDAQGGFRKGYSAQDSRFDMHALISLVFEFGEKTILCFCGF